MTPNSLFFTKNYTLIFIVIVFLIVISKPKIQVVKYEHKAEVKHLSKQKLQILSSNDSIAYKESKVFSNNFFRPNWKNDICFDFNNNNLDYPQLNEELIYFNNGNIARKRTIIADSTWRESIFSHEGELLVEHDFQIIYLNEFLTRKQKIRQLPNSVYPLFPFQPITKVEVYFVHPKWELQYTKYTDLSVYKKNPYLDSIPISRKRELKKNEIEKLQGILSTSNGFNMGACACPSFIEKIFVFYKEEEKIAFVFYDKNQQMFNTYPYWDGLNESYTYFDGLNSPFKKFAEAIE